MCRAAGCRGVLRVRRPLAVEGDDVGESRLADLTLPEKQPMGRRRFWLAGSLISPLWFSMCALIAAGRRSTALLRW
jgi:hypothetical protein